MKLYFEKEIELLLLCLLTKDRDAWTFPSAFVIYGGYANLF